MSALGDMPQLDAIITADTGWERKQTYEIRDWYKTWLQDRGIPVYIVSAGNIRSSTLEEKIRIPLWTSNGGPLARTCTEKFKITPIKHQIRYLLGYDISKPPHPKPGSAERWMGISLDEYSRMKSSEVKYIHNRYPLVENRITRQGCIEYLEGNGLPVPIKSACIGCPYRRASEWIELRDEDTSEWDDAIEFDEANRKNPNFIKISNLDNPELYVGIEILARETDNYRISRGLQPKGKQ